MDLMLDASTLVLNKNWVPVSTTPVRQALTLLCRASAAVICPQTYEVFELGRWLERSRRRAAQLERRYLIRTPRFAIERPEVILLSAFGGLPRMEVAFSRKNLFRRDGYRCQYCEGRRPTHELSIDHVIPRSRGGQTSWENCVLACIRCNTKKGNRTPRESGLKLRRVPARPAWSPLHETAPQARPDSWRQFLRNAV